MSYRNHQTDDVHNSAKPLFYMKLLGWESQQAGWNLVDPSFHEELLVAEQQTQAVVEYLHECQANLTARKLQTNAAGHKQSIRFTDTKHLLHNQLQTQHPQPLIKSCPYNLPRQAQSHPYQSVDPYRVGPALNARFSASKCEILWGLQPSRLKPSGFTVERAKHQW